MFDIYSSLIKKYLTGPDVKYVDIRRCGMSANETALLPSHNL